MLAKTSGIVYLAAAGMLYALWRLRHRDLDPSSLATSILLLTCGLATASCGSDMPGDVEPRNGTGLFLPPETVEVQVFGTVSGDEVNYRSLSTVERKWLSEHEYGHVRTEYDFSGTELLWDEGEEPGAALTDGAVVVGEKIYVRAP